MNLGLSEKVVFVTGSGKGIGKEIARKFAEEGSNIIINDVNSTNLEQCYKELSTYPVEVFPVLGNVAKEEEVSIMFEKIERKFQRVDILINNAGVLINKPFLEMTLKEWHHVILNNLDSIFLASCEAVKLMKVENNPVIINAGSFGGIIPANGYSVYNASKAAISNLTRTMAGELSPKGIRVAGYIPGVVKTDIIKEMLENEPERLVAQIPFKRLAEVHEIANVVVFISSNIAGYINGSMVEISGGKLCVQNSANY
ncbi:MAG: hypothetical protein CVU87_07545 [Firmicutes bacterium HGW-Firmicutes-12]|jgi:3-oxoacyl-[acyl-carrier protein] reductase|nr:MAG: hypothetical protein CVU87_07545 [Firmicutes bacterium HGW-Firmicutes-12]